MLILQSIEDGWFTIENIDSSTYAISEYGHWEKVHSFLVLGERTAVLIDTGLGIDNIKRVVNKLTKLPIVVLTTHVHWDHIGSHGEFSNIYVHEAEKEWLINGNGVPISYVRKEVFRDISKPIPDGFVVNTYEMYTGVPNGLLRDGDEIDLGNRKLIIYHTPGHSPGHIAIFDNSRGYLFTGDLLYSSETPVYAFYPTTNPLALVNSLEKISNISNITRIFGSHNKLGMDSDILEEVKHAVSYLREKELIRFGTGVHRFNGFSIKF